MTLLNFKANFIKNVSIPKQLSDGSIEMNRVSLVELDKKDKQDISTLAETSYNWNCVKWGYASDIYSDAIKWCEYPDVEKEHYYALTTQNENYKKLESDKILGLALYMEKKSPKDEIAWLQVNPSTNYESGKRIYKNIGTAIVSYIKQLSLKPLYVQSDKNAVEFYEKNGFEHIGDKPEKMCWNV